MAFGKFGFGFTGCVVHVSAFMGELEIQGLAVMFGENRFFLMT